MPRTSDAKEKLMEAAMELIWESSYGATSVDDICERADVRKGSFYHFFKSKSELEIAALEESWKPSKEKLDGFFSPTVPPLDRLRSYFDFAYARQAELQKECGCVLGCPLFSVGAELGTRDVAISQKVNEILGRYVKYFESAIRDAAAQGLIVAPDAKGKARLVFAYMQGMMTQARIENNLELLKELKKGALELLGAPEEVATAA
jgi:TetR/AcrR family transcriptional repressor of nem operon